MFSTLTKRPLILKGSLASSNQEILPSVYKDRKKGKQIQSPVATVVLEEERKYFNLVKGRRRKRFSLVPRKVQRALSIG